MVKRKREDIDLVVRQHPIMGMLWKETTTGVLFTLKVKNNDVHLQIYFNEKTQVLNAHITDRRPGARPRPWEMERSIKEMTHSMTVHFKKSIRRYKPWEMYWQFHPALLEAMGFGKQQPVKQYDIAPMIVAFAQGNPFRIRFLRSGIHSEPPQPGIMRRGNQYFLVMPIDKQRAWFMNSDIRKTPFWDIPVVRGFFAYFAYLEKHSIIDNSEWFSKEKRKRLQGTILALLAEVEAQ